jgi:hypothetical protein
VKLNLRTRQIERYKYALSTNTPVLHGRESFPAVSHELREELARLIAQEEKHGLLDNPTGIGIRAVWVRRLREQALTLKRHRLVKQNRQREKEASDGH